MHQRAVTLRCIIAQTIGVPSCRTASEKVWGVKLVRGSFCCLWPRFPGVDFAEVFFEDTWYRSLGCFRVTQLQRER